ncbi:MAG: hypothetical protein Phyf2KO_25460 [Phycisphaerales bacterium]
MQLERFNPAFPATHKEVLEDRQRMRDNPVALERPVIVLSGYRSPSGASSGLARQIRKLTGAQHDQVVPIAYAFAGTIGTPAGKVIDRVEQNFPSDDPMWTTEVDVVAISMGGLVARLAAAELELRGEPHGKRLKIGTLYTLASPHRGALLADWIAVDSASRDMVAGSELLSALDAAFVSADYELVPYAVLRDGWVGATRAAPVGQEPIWVPGRLFMSHHMVSLNRRIQTDLARRLRGEEPMGRPSQPPRN